MWGEAQELGFLILPSGFQCTTRLGDHNLPKVLKCPSGVILWELGRRQGAVWNHLYFFLKLGLHLWIKTNLPSTILKTACISQVQRRKYTDMYVYVSVCVYLYVYVSVYVYVGHLCLCLCLYKTGIWPFPVVIT